ncbi:Tubulin-specific chaperone C [Galdieria sulphuraria]|nr:Tubulin-specific chaperone C [Galdieria sulphuraria]
MSLCQETSSNQRLLTAYEKRKMNILLDEVHEGLQNIKDKLQPTRKLRWDITRKDKVSQEERKVPEDMVPSSQQIETVSDKSAQVIIQNLTDETSDVTDSLVSVDKRGWTRDCQIKNLRNCKVMIGPVQTAAYIQECIDCVVCVAAQQIRIHDCQRCVFRVQSKQGSILERSKDIVFGPYNYEYPGIEEDFQQVELYCEKDSWKKVRDFQFFSNPKENNWSLVEEDDDSFCGRNERR